jgi:hypothetical protein
MYSHIYIANDFHRNTYKLPIASRFDVEVPGVTTTEITIQVAPMLSILKDVDVAAVVMTEILVETNDGRIVETSTSDVVTSIGTGVAVVISIVVETDVTTTGSVVDVERRCRASNWSHSQGHDHVSFDGRCLGCMSGACLGCARNIFD